MRELEHSKGEELALHLAPLTTFLGTGSTIPSGAHILSAFAKLVALAVAQQTTTRTDAVSANAASDEVAPGIAAGASAVPIPNQVTPLRETLTTWEAQMQRNATLTERALDRVLGPEKLPPSRANYQQSLFVLGTAGGVTGARFVMRNSTGTRREITFLCQFGSDVPRSWRNSIVATFEPARVTLPPAGSETIKLRLDFSQCDASETRLEFAIDAVADGEALLRVWVEVELAP